ncbi:MAG: hypothetical protein R6V85_12560 [Polyangia bacterium]
MKKLTATIATALAAPLFATGAWSYESESVYDESHPSGFWFDENHVDDPENGSYVFWDDQELDDFLLEFASTVESPYDEQANTLGDCFAFRPIAYAVTTTHGEGTRWEHTHVDTDVRWNSGSSKYYVCYNDETHMYSNVDSIKGNWKTTSSSGCDYCDWDDWAAKYSKGNPYYIMDDYDCMYIFGTDDIVYWGEESSALTDFDYDLYDNMLKFERAYTSTDSEVYAGSCS